MAIRLARRTRLFIKTPDIAGSVIEMRIIENANLILCRSCGNPCLNHGERRLGCCTNCIKESKNTPLNMPRPTYSNKDDEGDDDKRD